MLKRILHIIEALDLGGAEKLLCNTVSELPEYEHLIVTVFSSASLALLPKNAKHVSLNAKSKGEVLFKGYAYKRILRRYKPDVVHAHLYFATVLAKAFTPKSVLFLFTQHFEFSKNTTKWYYAFADKMVSRKRQVCIAVSNAVLNDYIASTGFRGKTTVIGIYIPDHYFFLPQKKTGVPLKMIALGNIKPIKNQRYLLDAFALMKDLPVTCDVYGEGQERLELETIARQKKLPVFFKGSISDSSKVLPEYDLYVMPSLTEGFPLALFEAMAAGLPPVVSNIPAFHELLGECGKYLDLQQPGALRSVVEGYLRQPQKIKSEGEVVKALAEEKVSKEKYLRKIRQLYEPGKACGETREQKRGASR